MTTQFTDLNLDSDLVQTLTKLGYETPTPIQAAIIPILLTGQDVIGQSQTGTGKTAAFALPIVQNLSISHKRRVQSLVLAPTRELAIQVAEAMHKYGQSKQIRVLAVYGGQAYHRQVSELRRGIDVVVGTPGRLLDLIRQKLLDLSAVTTLVLDEADEMLSMGFIEDIEAILSETPAERQTALFSATLPTRIRRLAEQYMTEPEAFSIDPTQRTVDTIEQRYYLVNHTDKLGALTRIFEVEPISSALIFAQTRLGTGQLAGELTARGFPAEALNGDMSQDARIQILGRFRQGQIKVLVATDVAARGLDIDDISHVFNYDLPQDVEVYVHRVGRTGRAGKTGTAITLVTPKERWMLRRIESYAKQKLTQGTLPTVEEIWTYRETKLVEQALVWLKRGRCRREKEIVTALVEAGYDAIDIAAASLKVARGEEKQRPIAPISEVRESSSPRRSSSSRPDRPRQQRNNRNGARSARKSSHESGMVRVALDTGKLDGTRVNNVVGTLAFYADIPGSVLGRIQIQEHQTLVDVPEQFVNKVLAKTGDYRIGKQRIMVELA